MEKKKLGDAFSEVGKSAASFFGKAKESMVKVVDRNDDGTFDMKDVSAIVGAIGGAAQNAAAAIKENADARSREKELNTLRPIFTADLDSTDFVLSKLIRVTEIDKKHAESEVCKDSIGYYSEYKGLKIVNIYVDKVDAFRLSFYPHADSDVYYVDPSDRDRYIALDQYFHFLKISRVMELQRIAQDLGATHFKVVYKEIRSSSSQNSAAVKVAGKAGKDGVAVEATQDLSAKDISKTEVAAEMQCIGQPPKKPVLKFLQNDPSIQALIAMRMGENSARHLAYTLQLSDSSGIKEKDAIKIDAALKFIKLTGNVTLVSEAQRESRSYFEYEIDF